MDQIWIMLSFDLVGTSKLILVSHNFSNIKCCIIFFNFYSSCNCNGYSVIFVPKSCCTLTCITRSLLDMKMKLEEIYICFQVRDRYLYITLLYDLLCIIRWVWVLHLNSNLIEIFRRCFFVIQPFLLDVNTKSNYILAKTNYRRKNYFTSLS